MAIKLKRAYYLKNDVVGIAKDLLGKVLITNIDGCKSGGVIVETEAYSGSRDRASHAWPEKITSRTEVMFQKGGIAYVYLCYGIHHLFNIVTNTKGKPDAILIRAFEPTLGIQHILRRRNQLKLHSDISSGPGKVSACLGIDLRHNAAMMTGKEIWIEDIRNNNFEVVKTTRIGVDYAGEDANLPWRFYVKDNRYISRK